MTIKDIETKLSPKPSLYVMCGLSGSGKSTITKEYHEKIPGSVIISSDEIREELCDGNRADQSKNDEVFRVFHDRIRKNLEKHKSVIVDATNITMKSRRAILGKVNGLNINKICLIVPKPYEQCLVDNKQREWPVPDDVIEHQRSRFQIPFKEEGWTEIRIEGGFKDRPYRFDEMMKGYDQKSPYHAFTLDEHCQLAADMFFDIKGYRQPWYAGALLHDVGKLFTQTIDENGVAHYYSHENVGAYEILSLKPNEKDIVDICFLINYHMLSFSWNLNWSEPTRTMKRWQRRFGEEKYQMLLDFHECDMAMA